MRKCYFLNHNKRYSHVSTQKKKKKPSTPMGKPPPRGISITQNEEIPQAAWSRKGPES